MLERQVGGEVRGWRWPGQVGAEGAGGLRKAWEGLGDALNYRLIISGD